MSFNNLLFKMDEVELYKILGDAWFAQLQSEARSTQCREAIVDTGRREFNDLRPLLPVGMSRLDFHGAVTCASRTILESGTWQMPAPVIAALAMKQQVLRLVDRS